MPAKHTVANNFDEKYDKYLLDDRFSKLTKSINLIPKAIRTFTMTLVGKSMPIETSKGWRSKTFYAGDKFVLTGVRRCKHGGVVYSFGEFIPGASAWDKTEFSVAELSVDQVANVFGEDFENFLDSSFGVKSISDFLEIEAGGHKSWAVIESAPSLTSYIPTTTPVLPKTNAEIYANWGDF
jgi:hypothetical protein